jgi:hypothetical protein
MNKLAHNLVSLAKNLQNLGMRKEAKNLFFTAVKLAHMDHPLHEVVEKMGFEKAEDGKTSNLEIFIHVPPSGKAEYELTENGNSHDFDSFEELVAHLVDKDQSDCGCGCGGNCKTAAAKKKNQGKKLNKPFRTPGGPKKFSVYVKNEKGNVIKVNFGDPNMSIKRDQPNRRKNFRARHNCDNPGPKTKARYWSCRMWSKPSVSKILKGK